MSRKIGDIVKRIIDLTLVILGSPFVLILSIYVIYRIKKDSPGKVIYAGKRVGKNGKLFPCYKFRSMYCNGDDILEQFFKDNPDKKEEYDKYHKLDDDPRVTPFGNFIRRTSIDELPQIWNVLLGDMSLVGPRPYLPTEINEMEEAASLILTVKPGITGYWQVNGRSNVDFESRILMDRWYVKSKNLLLDIKILWQTIGVVLVKHGAK